MKAQVKLVCSSSILVVLLISFAAAQRSPYAGSRPGGLNQKDKYRPTFNLNGSDVGVANRFGASASTNSIAYGVAQNPPIAGAEVVGPNSIYVPLPNPRPPIVGVPEFTINNRLGGTDNVPTTSTAGVAGAAGVTGGNAAGVGGVAGAGPVASTGAMAGAGAVAGSNGFTGSRLPFDAHGDQQLVDQLSRLPVERQPFWFVNYQAIEAHRNGSNSNFAGAVNSRGSFFG